MSDDLLVPDKRIVSIDEAKSEQKARPTHGTKSDFVTRKWADARFAEIEEQWKAAAAAGVVAMGDKMYQQASEELAENFEDMQAALLQNLDAKFARIYAEIEERFTWKGRWRRFKAWVRGIAMEVGAVDPLMSGEDFMANYGKLALDSDVLEAETSDTAVKISGLSQQVDVRRIRWTGDESCLPEDVARGFHGGMIQRIDKALPIRGEGEPELLCRVGDYITVAADGTLGVEPSE
jgi:hypothetical protein